MTNPSTIVSEIFAGFRQRGRRTRSEGVTEEQHALSCATLAGDAGELPEMIAACLLHDFGRLFVEPALDGEESVFAPRHEQIGANALARWFDPEVVEPIRLHTEAKRYLCWKEAGYLRGLSRASRRCLPWEGGPMTDAEAFEFEVHPHFRAAVALRRYDDLCVRTGPIPSCLETFRPLLESLVRRAREERFRGWLAVSAVPAPPAGAAAKWRRRRAPVCSGRAT